MMMMMMVVVVVMITALQQRRACEIPSIMPATRLFLLRPFSLLLLVLGPHLFVGSFSLGSASSPSPAERPSVATAGPRAAATIQEGSAFLAASSSRLPREKGSPQPSAASVSVWDRTADRDGGSDSPGPAVAAKAEESVGRVKQGFLPEGKPIAHKVYCDPLLEKDDEFQDRDKQMLLNCCTGLLGPAWQSTLLPYCH